MIRGLKTGLKRAAMLRRFTNNYEKRIPVANLKIEEYLKDSCREQNINYLTPIQEKSLPFLLEEVSSAILSETGSGKTLAYGLPIMNHIIQNPERVDMHGALILTTNKELTIQIYAELRNLDPENKVKISRLGSISHITPHVDYISKKQNERPSRTQLNNLSEQNIINTVNWRKLDVVIGTPSQLFSIIKAKNRSDAYDLNPKYLVIDEFDQILADGNQFESLKHILRQFAGRNKSHLSDFNQDRVVTISGATLQKKFNKVDTEDLLKDWFPGIEILKSENYLKISPKIEHEVFNVEELDEKDKMLLLEQLIDRYFEEVEAKLELAQDKKILIFVNNSVAAENISDYLNQNMIPTTMLHSKMSVNDRVKSLSEFKQGEDHIAMVCTDIASRGLDIDNVGLVIQYSFATNATTLLHRFGRTGRLNKEGKVISMLTDKDSLLYHEFEDLRKSGSAIQPLFSRKRSFSKSRKFEHDLMN